MKEIESIKTVLQPTAMQVGLVAENELAEIRGINIVQIVGSIDGQFDRTAFESAWNQAIHEFDVLRMSLQRSDQGVIEARFEPAVGFECDFVDLSKMPARDAEEAVRERIESRRIDGIAVSIAPAMRVDCFRSGSAHWRFLWTFHHSLLEGYSIYLIIKRLFDIYDARRRGEKPDAIIHPEFRGFLDFSGRQDHGNGFAYFRDLLENFETATPLPFSRRRQPPEKLQSGLVTARLSAADTSLLESAARKLEATPNTIAQFCWALLLSRYSGETDVVFGATWSLRSRKISDSMLMAGLLMNTSPVRVHIQNGKTVRDALLQLRAQHHRSKPFRHTPLNLLRTECGFRPDQPLFQSVFVFDYQKYYERLRAAGPAWANRSFEAHRMTGNPLTVEIHFLEGQLVVEIEHRAGLFTQDQAKRLIQSYLRLLKNVTRDLERPVEKVRMLSDSDFCELVSDQTNREIPSGHPDVVDSVVRGIDRHSEKTAVESPDGTSMTYAELDLASRTVVGELTTHGAAPNNIAAIVLPRSTESIVAMLGALRAGVAYLPIDPQYPAERIHLMLRDSNPQFILASKSTAGLLPRIASKVVLLDSLEACSSIDLPSPVSPESLAYVIYTSGSTGNPKGVCVPRSAISNHCHVFRRVFELRPDDRVLQFMSHSFDASFEEIFPTISAGATLVLRSEESITTADRFFDEIERQRITVLNLPTAFWHNLVKHKGANQWPSSLRLLVIGGERAFDDTYRLFREQNTSHIRFLNSYGPTEAAITSTFFDDRSVDEEATLPIGKPIAAVSHFVLDSSMRPVPRGEVGQLFIGGAGLATGYLGQPARTAASFVPHPFKEGAVLYATGDLVYLTEKGNFVYLERADNQVKIRGYRIEPGEIEAHLVSLPHVIEAAVVPATRASHYVTLVAHVVVDADSITEMQIRDSIAESVPAHLVPAEIRIHAELPKSVSGKVDRRRLNELAITGKRLTKPLASKRRHHAPLFETEIRDIWAGLLNQTLADEEYDFFEAGGDSLRLLQLFAEIEHRTRQKPNPATFLQCPTLENIIQLVEDQRFAAATQLLVTMNKGDQAIRPLFLVPGVCGLAVDYVHLANALDPSIPVFGAQIDEIGDHAESALHEYALRLIPEIRRIQETGPYAVAGYSAGAVIALEVARVLIDGGHQVDFLGIIDGVPPNSVERRSPFTNPTRFFRFLTAVAKKAKSQRADSSSGLGWLFQRLKPSIVWSYFAWTRPSRQPQEVSELLHLPKGRVADHLVAKWQRTLDAVHAYRHQAIHVEMTLFRTATDPVAGPHEADLGWGQIQSKSVLIERLPGIHTEILAAKTAPTLAKLMEPHLLTRTWSKGINETLDCRGGSPSGTLDRSPSRMI